ncbi:hypothetical protein QQF73_11565 [Marinobacter sp. M216]|uniref:Carboxypeptidase regulatory-like domain-containing protein n=1 Tax=Marinobacter albus TaxID=3030833 RepID=A0ABT7HE08_9GAMM|nr:MULTISPECIES: hypothetical protein [unclassified Marinobacter]MBW7469470.1 hypothetical protein [Marinobacter sp. F4218]MDK9558259.1 hypothetical protein [Marinobacter sp. M216]
MEVTVMGKWLAGIAASVIAAVIGWVVIGILNAPPPSPPALRVSAWYAPEPAQVGKIIDLFVKVRREDDEPVPNAKVKLTPISGTFMWAGSSSHSINGVTGANGLYSTKFQTVLQVGVIGGTPPPGTSKTGSISIFVSKAGYADSKTELRIETEN